MLKFHGVVSAHVGNCILLLLFQIAPLVHQSCDTLSKKLEKYAESGEKVDMWRWEQGLISLNKYIKQVI